MRTNWAVANTDKTYFDVKAIPGAMSIEFKVASFTNIGNGPYSSITEVAMQYTGIHKCAFDHTFCFPKQLERSVMFEIKTTSNFSREK